MQGLIYFSFQFSPSSACCRTFRFNSVQCHWDNSGKIRQCFPWLYQIFYRSVWVYYTFTFVFSCFDTLERHFATFKTTFFWFRMTDEGSVPEMHIWFILLIQSHLKCWIHRSTSIFLCFSFSLRVIKVYYLDNNVFRSQRSTLGYPHNWSIGRWHPLVLAY